MLNKITLLLVYSYYNNMNNNHFEVFWLLYAVILAGGKGTRLYPLSRENNPKQFLEIINDRSFLKNTVNRIKPMVNKENIYIVTNENYKQKIYDELPEINVENVFIEPINKETHYFTTWAAIANMDMLRHHKKQYVIIVTVTV